MTHVAFFSAAAAKKAATVGVPAGVLALTMPTELVTLVVGFLAPASALWTAWQLRKQNAPKVAADTTVSSVTASAEAVALMQLVMDEALAHRDETISALRKETEQLRAEVARLSDLLDRAIDAGFVADSD